MARADANTPLKAKSKTFATTDDFPLNQTAEAFNMTRAFDIPGAVNAQATKTEVKRTPAVKSCNNMQYIPLKIERLQKNDFKKKLPPPSAVPAQFFEPGKPGGSYRHPLSGFPAVTPDLRNSRLKTTPVRNVLVQKNVTGIERGRGKRLYLPTSEIPTYLVIL